MNDYTPVIDELEAATAPVFVTHRHADRDSLGSALGLQAILGRGTVCTPAGVNRAAQTLASTVSAATMKDPDEATYDTVVVLDTPSSDAIGSVDPDGSILIDHHERADINERASATLVDTEAGATAEVVARLADAAGWTLGPDAALPLIVGLFADTGSLVRGSADTVQVAGQLLSALDGRADELPGALTRSVADAQQTARTLGTLRATGYRAGDTVVAVSRVGAHESDAANALLEAGADLAVVCSEQAEGVRVTARGSDSFAERVNLGADLLPRLADRFGGDGGGHDGAGGAQLDSGSLEAVKSSVIDELEAALGVTFSRI